MTDQQALEAWKVIDTTVQHAWGNGYDAGQKGLSEAVATAKLTGKIAEQHRIAALLKEHLCYLPECIDTCSGMNKHFEYLLDLVYEIDREKD